jgi:hypothetical protein
VLLADRGVQLGLGYQRGDGVDDQDVDRAGGDQQAGDLQRLLAAFGVAQQQPVGVHAARLGPGKVEGVLGVDEHARPAGALRLGEHREGQGGLADALGAVDLADPAAGDAADAQGVVQGEAAGGDHRGRGRGGAVGAGHDRGAELLGDGVEGGLQAPVMVVPLGMGGWSDRCRGGWHAKLLPLSLCWCGRVGGGRGRALPHASRPLAR